MLNTLVSRYANMVSRCFVVHVQHTKNRGTLPFLFPRCLNMFGFMMFEHGFTVLKYFECIKNRKSLTFGFMLFDLNMVSRCSNMLNIPKIEGHSPDHCTNDV